MWSAIRSLTGSDKRNDCCTIHPDKLNDYFTEIGNSLLPIKNACFNAAVIEAFCRKISNSSQFFIPQMSINDVVNHILKLKNKNSCGFDGISPKILKLSTPCIAESLTYLYNLCLDKSYFPISFKYAKIIPLHKKGHLDDVNNFRPISLLSAISKPLERHIHMHMESHMEKNKLLYINQSGFRKNHSCETALCRITNAWLSHINNGKAVGVVFIDLTKAFDLINHDILLQKLKLYGLSEPAISFFKSYLSNRTQSVSLNGVISSKKDNRRGVPQGSILGPLLFSLYINDLPLSVKNAICDLFADDTSLQYASFDINDIEHNLNRSMNAITDWCRDNDMLVHPDKTESMLICSRQKRQIISRDKLNIFVNNNPINQVKKKEITGNCH